MMLTIPQNRTFKTEMGKNFIWIFHPNFFYKSIHYYFISVFSICSYETVSTNCYLVGTSLNYDKCLYKCDLNVPLFFLYTCVGCRCMNLNRDWCIMAMVRTIDNWIWRCSLLRNDFVISNQCSQCNSLLSLAESKQINETLVKDSSLLWEIKLKKTFKDILMLFCVFEF